MGGYNYEISVDYRFQRRRCYCEMAISLAGLGSRKLHGINQISIGWVLLKLLILFLPECSIPFFLYFNWGMVLKDKNL